MSAQSASAADEDWDFFVRNIDVNSYLTNRTCDVLFCVEKTCENSPTIERFVFGSYIEDRNQVKCLTFESLRNDIQNAALRISIPFGNVNVEKNFQNAAVKYHESIINNELVPSGVMARFIKFQILRIIDCDLFLEKSHLYHLQQLAASRLELIEDSTAKGKGKDKRKGQGKGKGKDKGKKSDKGKAKGKDKGKKSDKGKKGKSGKSKETVDVCASRLNLETKYESALSKRKYEEKKLQLDKIQAPNKHLYIALIGFLEPNLLQELIYIGVNIACVLEVGKSDINVYRNFSTYQELKRSSQYYLGETFKHSDDSSDSKSKTPTSPSDVSENTSTSNSSSKAEEFERAGSESALLFFWSKIYSLFQSDRQYHFLRNTFHIQYTTDDEFIKDAGEKPEVFEHESINCFRKMSDFIRKLPEIHRQYATYMHNLKILNLGPELNYLTVSCLSTYRRMMDQVSPECFTIALLLHCLIEEVCARKESCQPLNKNSNRGKSAFNIKPESMLLIDSLTKQFPKHNFSDSARGQLLAVITKYSKISDLKKEPPAINYETHFPKINIQLNCRPFRAHEDNILEVMINAYSKRLARNLFEINMKPLVLLPPVLLLHKRVDPDVKRQWDKDLTIWSKELEILPTDLISVINIWEFLKSRLKKCLNSTVTKTNCFELENKFVTRTNSEYLEFQNVSVSYSPNFNRNSNESISVEEEIKVNKEPSASCEAFDSYLPNFKYCEFNVDCVLLQQINAAFNEFQNVDYEFIDSTNSLMLYFYDNFDENGAFTEVFHQSIPTPICLRDYCRFIAHEEIEWITSQEVIYQKEQDEQIALQNQKDQLYQPPTEFTILENIQPGSLKESLLLAEDEEKGDKKKGKSKGKKGEKAPKKGGKPAKKGKGGKDKKDNVLQYFKQLETFPSPAPPPLKPLIRTALPNEPYSFIGYDLGKVRLQLTGSISTIKSEDGIKVTIDQTRWLGGNKSFSIKVNALDHLLLLHMAETKNEEPFLFHFRLPDDTIVAFQRPERKEDLQGALCERIYRSLVDKRTKRSPRQNIYCLAETHDIVTRTLNIPFILKRNIIMNESSLKPLLRRFHTKNITHNVNINQYDIFYANEMYGVDNGGLLEEPVGDDEMDRKSSFNDEDDLMEPSSICLKFKRVNTPKLNVILPRGNGPTESFTEENAVPFTHRKYIQRNGSIIYLKLKSNDLLNKLKQAFTMNYPIFKICSSALHRNQYVKRVKPYIEIPSFHAVRRILLKSPFLRPRTTIEVSKCYPIVISENNSKIRSLYDMKLSLLSGLMVTIVPGFDSAPFQVKQYYVEKGSLSKVVAEEEYRIFHDGNVIIKKCDGNFTILNVNGTITYFEVPYFKKQENVKYEPQPKKKISCNKCQIPLHVCVRNLPKFQKLVYRSILRRQKYVIDSFESRFYRSRKALERKEKQKIKQHKFYLVTDNAKLFKEFKILTPDGKQIKAKSEKILKTRKFYVKYECDYNTEERIIERGDGMISLLNRETVLVTQFPDGTRIKTSILADEKLVSAFDDEPKCPTSKSKGCNIDSCPHIDCRANSSKGDTGWVLLSLKYEYEHPCYAKIIYSDFDQCTEIQLSNNVVLKCCENGQFYMKMNTNIEAKLSDKKLQIKCKPCVLCPCESICTINVKPFYYLQSILNHELLKLSDKHGQNFTAVFDGDYLKVSNKIKSRKNSPHCEHDFTEKRKLFAMAHDLSGCKFWETKILEKYKTLSKGNTSMTLHRESQSSNIRCMTFTTKVREYYVDHFLRPHLQPRIWLKKDHPPQKSEEKTAYTTYRTVNLLPPLNKIDEVFKVIEKVIQEPEMNYKNIITILSKMRIICTPDKIEDLEDLESRVGKTKTSSEDIIEAINQFHRHNRFKNISKFSTKFVLVDMNFESPLKLDVESAEDQISKYFHNAKSLYEKWYVWHYVYNWYWSKIREPDIPKYFKSKNCPYPPPPKPCKPRTKYSLLTPKENTDSKLLETQENSNIEYTITQLESKGDLKPDFFSLISTPNQIINFAETDESKVNTISIDAFAKPKHELKSKSEFFVQRETDMKVDDSKSVPDMLNILMENRKSKQKSRSPFCISKQHQMVICNVFTVSQPNVSISPCAGGTEKHLAETNKPEPLKRNLRACFAKEVCDVNHLDQTDLICETYKKNEASTSTTDNKSESNMQANEIIAALKKAIDTERNNVLSCDTDNPQKCFFQKTSEIPKIIANYLTELVVLKEDINTSYMKATLLQDILMEIGKLKMTQAELETFLETLDEELKIRNGQYLPEQQESEGSVEDTVDTENEKEEDQLKVVYKTEKAATYESKDVKEVKMDSIIMLITQPVAKTEVLSGYAPTKERMHSYLSRNLGAESPSLKLFHDISLYERVVLDSGSYSTAKNLKSLKSTLCDKPQRDFRTKIIPLRNILDKSPNILQMIPESIHEDYEEGEDYDFPDKLIDHIPMLFADNEQTVEVGQVSVSNLRKSEDDTENGSNTPGYTSSLKVELPSEEGYFQKASDIFSDFRSVDNLFHMSIATCSSGSDNVPVNKIGGIYGKITDNEQQILSNTVHRNLSEYKILKPSYKKIVRDPKTRECVGTQTQMGKEDAQSQCPNSLELTEEESLV